MKPEPSRILSVARQLAFPRYPGTAADKKAIDLVAAWFRETGLEVAEEWFSYDIRPAFRALRTLLVGAAILVGAAGFLAARSALWATMALVIALVSSGIFLGWAPWLEALYRREGPTRTANVVARRPAAGRPRMTLVLLAHHDSKSQNLTLPFRAGLTLAAIAGAIGLVLDLGFRALPNSPQVAGWAAPALGSMSAVSLLILATLRSGDESPGGVDNAGSVGILVELAHHLPVELAPDVEIIFLSPGAEEDHMVGAMRWLDANLAQLAGCPIWAINLDGAGIPGRVTLLERYGFGKMFSPSLSRIARSAAARLGIPIRGVLIPPAMGVDAIPFVHRDVPCLTLTSGSLGRAALAVHSKDDRFEHLDGEALERVAQLVSAMAIELAASAPKKSRDPQVPAGANR